MVPKTNVLQEAAKDVVAQEAIAAEVRSFMAKSGSMQEDDLSTLEEIIRQRLSGRTPPCASALRGRLLRVTSPCGLRLLQMPSTA